MACILCTALKSKKHQLTASYKAAKPVLWGSVKSSVWLGTRLRSSALSAVLSAQSTPVTLCACKAQLLRSWLLRS